MGSSARKNAFLECLAPLRDALFRHARRMAWRKDDASDILQEAVMTAWREFDRFQPGTSFSAWMFRILINTGYRINKYSRLRRTASLDENLTTDEGVIQRENAWAYLLEHPERLNDMLDARLVHALDQLATNERECLLLRLVEGFSYKEIAAMLDLPLGTVMSHIHRGRSKLRERLADLAVEVGLVKEPVQ
ncbi:MAG: sigma-70 family RNA polymerase sigma factor [Phycisphaerae bacterium]